MDSFNRLTIEPGKVECLYFKGDLRKLALVIAAVKERPMAPKRVPQMPMPTEPKLEVQQIPKKPKLEVPEEREDEVQQMLLRKC